MGPDAPAGNGRGRRCDRHGLAIAPDGLCALCRRESLPPARSLSTWVLGGILAAVLLVSAGVTAHRAAGSLSRSLAITSEDDEGQEDREVAPGGAREELASSPGPDPQAPAPAGESAALREPLPPPIAAARPVNTSTPPSALTAVATAPPRAQPTPAQLQAAFAATPIVMYSTSWCPVCRNAKRFLVDNGLPFQEIDADQTPGGWDKIQALAGRRAVPVIVVDGEVSQGLSPERILRGVARSMERRLGISGVTFQAK